MGRIVVGEIQGYEVIYVPEKDYVFCKNTALPLSTMIDVLKSEVDRIEIPEKNLVIKISDSSIDMGCLSTTRDNLCNIKKTISKLKDCNGKRKQPE